MISISGRIIPDYPAGSRRIWWQDVSGLPGRIRPDYVKSLVFQELQNNFEKMGCLIEYIK